MGEQTIKRKSKNDTEFECYDLAIDKISFIFKSDGLPILSTNCQR